MATPKSTSQKRQKTQDQLITDIWKLIKAGQLSPKACATQVGCGTPRAKDIFDHFVTEGLLEKVGRRYRVKEESVQAASGSASGRRQRRNPEQMETDKELVEIDAVLAFVGLGGKRTPQYKVWQRIRHKVRHFVSPSELANLRDQVEQLMKVG